MLTLPVTVGVGLPWLLSAGCAGALSAAGTSFDKMDGGTDNTEHPYCMCGLGLQSILSLINSTFHTNNSLGSIILLISPRYSFHRPCHVHRKMIYFKRNLGDHSTWHSSFTRPLNLACLIASGKRKGEDGFPQKSHGL